MHVARNQSQRLFIDTRVISLTGGAQGMHDGVRLAKDEFPFTDGLMFFVEDPVGDGTTRCRRRTLNSEPDRPRFTCDAGDKRSCKENGNALYLPEQRRGNVQIA